MRLDSFLILALYKSLTYIKSLEATTYSAWRRDRRWGTSDDRRRCVRTSSWLHRLVSSPRPAARSTAGLHHSDGRGTARDARPPVPIAISHSRPTLDAVVHSTHYTRPCSVSSHFPPHLHLHSNCLAFSLTISQHSPETTCTILPALSNVTRTQPNFSSAAKSVNDILLKP